MLGSGLLLFFISTGVIWLMYPPSYPKTTDWGRKPHWIWFPHRSRCSKLWRNAWRSARMDLHGGPWFPAYTQHGRVKLDCRLIWIQVGCPENLRQKYMDFILWGNRQIRFNASCSNYRNLWSTKECSWMKYIHCMCPSKGRVPKWRPRGEREETERKKKGDG